MKRCIPVRLIVKDKGGKKYFKPIFWFLPVGLDVLENEGISEKGCSEIEN